MGIATQVFLVCVIIGYVMPFFGLELLDMTEGRGRLQSAGVGGEAFRGRPVAVLPRGSLRNRSFSEICLGAHWLQSVSLTMQLPAYPSDSLLRPQA